MEGTLRELTRGNALFFILILGIGAAFQVGFQATCISSPAPFIRTFINSSWYQRYEEIPALQTVTLIWSMITTAFPVGALFGAASVKHVTGTVGRKKAMIGNGPLFLIGGVLMLTSKYANSFEMVMAGRFFMGCGAGLGGSIHLMYLGESCPTHLRGTLSISIAVFLSLGKLSAQVLGLSELLGQEHLWNVLLFSPTCLVAVQMLTLPLFPEAPRYLLNVKGDVGACKIALQRLWGPGEYQVEIDAMLADKSAAKGVRIKSLLEILQDRSVRGQIRAIMILMACLQMSGLSAVTIFSFDILSKAGVPIEHIRYIMLGFGIGEVLGTVIAATIVDWCGRKPLMLGGFSSMLLSLLLVSITLNLKEFISPGIMVAYGTAALVMIFIICVSVGPNAANLALMNDCFDQSQRPAAFSIFAFQRWGQFALMSFIFPFMLEGMGTLCFLLFACSCLLGALYSFFVVPETKGKTQQEISQQFKTFTVCGKFLRGHTVTETKL